MRGAESYLLSLGEVVGDISIEFHGTDVLDGVHLLWDILGAVKDVERKLVLVFNGDELNTELPLGVSTSVDSVVQVSSVEVWVLSIELQCFVPY